jgi:hypothetical protein
LLPDGANQIPDGPDPAEEQRLSRRTKTPVLCALQAIDQDANFAENPNQLILFDF